MFAAYQFLNAFSDQYYLLIYFRFFQYYWLNYFKRLIYSLNSFLIWAILITFILLHIGCLILKYSLLGCWIIIILIWQIYGFFKENFIMLVYFCFFELLLKILNFILLFLANLFGVKMTLILFLLHLLWVEFNDFFVLSFPIKFFFC